MNRLRVGLTTSIESVAASDGRSTVFLYTSYIHALEQIGLVPVLITPSHSPGDIEALIDVCDGLVLSGGEDVNPSCYGEKPSPALGKVCPPRDAMEFRALECALARQMPVLGICRGMQLLNVHFGGTLIQDIATERSTDLFHEQREPWNQRSHAARVCVPSRLHDIVEQEQLFINSFHHQAVKRVGDGLIVSAVAEDGLIEAVEHQVHDWVVGVQWHPERNEAAARASDPDRRIFLAFREAVTEFGGVRA